MSRANDVQVGGDHYKKMGIQPWEVVDTWPLEQRIGYYRGDALSYLMRFDAKNDPVEDISKGIHYLQKLVEVLREAQQGGKQFDLRFMGDQN